MSKQKQALFFLFFAILSWVDVSAQLISEDVVYLKNGNIVRGIIVKNENDTLTVAGFKRYFFTFKLGNVEKTEKQDLTLSKRSIRSEIVRGYKGFYSLSTFGMLVGKSKSEDSKAFSFHTIFGYGFNRFAGLGLGVGIEKLQTEIIPLFVSFKSVLLERSNAPVFLCHVGYSFPLSEKKDITENYNTYTSAFKGGLNAGFDIGIQSFKSRDRVFNITVGYNYQLIKESHTLNYWWQNSTESNTYQFNRIAVKIGFMFM